MTKKDRLSLSLLFGIIVLMIATIPLTSSTNGIYAEATTFGTKMNLSNNAGDSHHPEMVVNGLNVYVVWFDETTGNGDIYFKASNNSGVTFGAKKNLSNNAGTSIFPMIAVSGNHVYVVWNDDTPGNDEIFFRASADGGATWGTTKNLSADGTFSFDPHIATDGNNVYVIWDGINGVLFRASTDGGATWGAKKTLSNNLGEAGSIAIGSAGRIFVAWTGQNSLSSDSDIFMVNSTDNGATFSTKKDISNDATGSFDSTITTQGNNVYLVWDNCDSGICDTMFRKSADNGATWGIKKNLSSSADIDSYYPLINVQGSNVYVAWIEGHNTTNTSFDIYFRASTDGGATWAAKKNISNDVGDSNFPYMAASGNNVYIAWEDYSAPTSEARFRESTDGGATFAVKKNISNNAGDSFDPHIALSGSEVFIVWHDDTSGNFEIYLKKGS